MSYCRLCHDTTSPNTALPDTHDPGCTNAPKPRQIVNLEPIIAERADMVATLIERDPHQWSARPCQTCSVVSGLIGRAFGCEKRGAR